MKKLRPHRAAIFPVCFLLCLVSLTPGETGAGVYHSRESALRLAFPDAEDIVKREIFLDADKKADIERLARAELQSRLVTVYVGKSGQRVLGYAVIETHKVRSLPETILVVVDPDGRTRAVVLLAFHEPPEYAPTDRWLAQFFGRPLDDDLSLRTGIDGITGATLTANSINASVRRILAVLEVAVDKQATGDTGTDLAPVGSDE